MPAQLARTALHDAHVGLGARMVPFAGWDMPIQYRGIVAEHSAVRNAWGVFDVSHMGRIAIDGPNAIQLLDHVLAAPVSALDAYRGRYTVICQEDGGIIDDTVVVNKGSDRVLLVCNAGSRNRVVEWLRSHAEKERNVAVTDHTTDTFMVAAQGPEATRQLEDLFEYPIGRLKRFAAAVVSWRGLRLLVTRTGYTGEDGYEMIGGAASAQQLWSALLAKGAAPCGLGSRDILRLEAGLLLYGNDMDTTVNPIEAGLERFVRLDERGFVGEAALSMVKEKGAARRLVGLRTEGRGTVPRQGHPILDGEEAIGQVTSGSFSPSLGANIALGYVPATYAEQSTGLTILCRDTRVPVRVTPLPFYKRRTA